MLSVQPLDDDANAWSSDLARAADFKALARDRQKVAQVQARLGGVEAALAEARRRAASGDSLWQRVDFNTVGIAGYELGTQAAMTPQLQAQAKAVLALSLVTEGVALAPADAPVKPLMLVSSRRDSDPTGLVDSPSQRSESAFAHLPSGKPADGRFLLMLDAATHAALSGSANEADELASAAAQQQQQARGGQQGGQRQGGGGKHRGGGGGSNSRNATDEPSAPSAAGMYGASAGSQEAAAVIEGTSTAFWDASLRGRPQALAWLQQSAAAWMQGLGEWTQHGQR